jgi:hypothetical protein
LFAEINVILCTHIYMIVYDQVTCNYCQIDHHGERVKKGKAIPVTGRERGRSIAQAVSRWLPTAAARIQTRV